MRFSFTAGLLAISTGSGLAHAAVTPRDDTPPALPLDKFAETQAHPLPVDQWHTVKGKHSDKESQFAPTQFATQPNCATPHVRKEWNNLPDDMKQKFIDAIKCLMSRPSAGGYKGSTSRYEDFVVVHQQLTPNVHGNAKFLPWHRYYIWAFEDELRKVCGYPDYLPWFDESHVAGNFPSSSLFSNQWFGAVDTGGDCVRNGQFPNWRLNIGPGVNNGAHCLARNNNDDYTANCAESNVNICQGRTDYADYEACSEGGCHAWGHNGIGAVMSDVYASPGDPVFFVHHGFIDRNWRIWQNNAVSRYTTIDGVDRNGNPLTTSTTINIMGLRPDIAIGNILNTLGQSMCYKYNY